MNYPYITVSPYCPREQGACAAVNGQAQSSGKNELRDSNGSIPATQDECLELCKSFPNATGCEVLGINRNIGGVGDLNRKCYVHTNNITSGNGESGQYCWVFSHCQTGIQNFEIVRLHSY